jgi:hypothetical protein
MGEFWTRYLMDSGERLSKRQAKNVERLEERVLECMVLINHFENQMDAYLNEIARIKKGGERQLKTCLENENNF